MNEFDDFLSRSRADSHANSLPQILDLLAESRTRDSFEFDRRKTPVIPTTYSVLNLRVTLKKPIQLREVCAVTWTCSDSGPSRDSKNIVLFVVRADGKPHNVTIPLGSQIQWVTSGPVTHIGFKFGNQQGGSISLERASFVKAPVEWKLPRS
jgi:hypothetical protein